MGTINAAKGFGRASVIYSEGAADGGVADRLIDQLQRTARGARGPSTGNRSGP